MSPIDTQSKNVIFMIIEPHASIIAACLPALGPLLAKGRMLDSIIRSFRSVISLAGSPSGSANSRGSGRNRSGFQNMPNQAADNSTIELSPYKPGFVSVSANLKTSQSTDEPYEDGAARGVDIPAGVNVTRGVNVTTEPA